MIVFLLYKQRTLKTLIVELRKKLALDKEISEINKYRETTNNIYDNVLEADVTNNCLLGENTKTLAELIGIPDTATFTDCLDAILIHIVQEEFRDIYKNAFLPELLLERYEKGEKMFSFEFIEKANLVDSYWTRATVCTYYSQATKSVRIISYIKNIQQEKDEKLRLKELAYTDSLTQVLNVGGFLHGIETVFRDRNNKSALYIIDLDRFKQINDIFGHQQGDAVLVEVGMTLKKIFSNNAIIGRLGGDEFVILFNEYKDIEELELKAENLCNALRKSYIQNDLSVHISGSVGISIFPVHGTCFDTLYRNADIALYHAKQNGKNQYSIYNILENEETEGSI